DDLLVRLGARGDAGQRGRAAEQLDEAAPADGVVQLRRARWKLALRGRGQRRRAAAPLLDAAPVVSRRRRASRGGFARGRLADDRQRALALLVPFARLLVVVAAHWQLIGGTSCSWSGCGRRSARPGRARPRPDRLPVSTPCSSPP